MRSRVGALRAALGACLSLAFASGCSLSPGAGPALPAADRSDDSRIASPADSENLLYIADRVTHTVYVRALPKGNQIGTISGLLEPEGECSDAKGNVFVTDEQMGIISEYAHGGTNPIAYLIDKYRPVACSLDPTTGDLAVANLTSGGLKARGILTVYPNARGRPNYLFRKGMSFNYCGYDRYGNLYIDGYDTGNAFGFLELRKGTRTFTPVSLDTKIAAPGGVQWDGAHVAVGDGAGHAIYRFKIDGYHGTQVGATLLAQTKTVGTLWIQGNTAFVGEVVKSYEGEVNFYRYPAGGKPYVMLVGFAYPSGITVSRSGQSSATAP